MRIISHVCADFYDSEGAVIFSVTPSDRKSLVEAPEAIRQDPLFAMLVSDGSIEAVISDDRKRVLEQDPETGIDETGKAIRIPVEEAGDKPAKASKSAKSAKVEKADSADPGTDSADKAAGVK